jgi:hypothetical protein
LSGIFRLPNLDFDFFFHQWLQKEPRTKKIRNNNFEIRNGCQAFSGYLIWILISFFTSGFKKIQEPSSQLAAQKPERGTIIKLKIPE